MDIDIKINENLEFSRVVLKENGGIWDGKFCIRKGEDKFSDLFFVVGTVMSQFKGEEEPVEKQVVLPCDAVSVLVV